MNEYRSASGDNLKLMLAVLGMALFSILTFGAGLIPVGIMVLGAFLAWRSRDTKNVLVTSRLMQFCLVLGGALLFYHAVMYEFGASYYEDRVIEGWSCFIGAVAVQFLWIGPVTRKIESLESVDISLADEAPTIMQRESLASYSTADELRKWRSLLDDGTITEKQFDDARQKLLNG